MNIKKSINEVSIEEVAKVIEGSIWMGSVDLGAVLFSCVRHPVMGDLIAASTLDGKCALIHL